MTTTPDAGGQPDPPSLASTDAGVHAALGMSVVEVSADRAVVTVPVTERVHQPYGLLHGGVSALLAESAASIGGAASVPAGKAVVGIELNASHLHSVRRGTLTAVATPLRKGRTIQVWDIAVSDDADRLICQARCTLAVVDAPTVTP